MEGLGRILTKGGFEVVNGWMDGEGVLAIARYSLCVCYTRVIASLRSRPSTRLVALLLRAGLACWCGFTGCRDGVKPPEDCIPSTTICIWRGIPTTAFVVSRWCTTDGYKNNIQSIFLVFRCLFLSRSSLGYLLRPSLVRPPTSPCVAPSRVFCYCSTNGPAM